MSEPWWQKATRIIDDEPSIPESKNVWTIRSEYYDNTDNYNIISNTIYFIGFIVLIRKYGKAFAI